MRPSWLMSNVWNWAFEVHEVLVRPQRVLLTHLLHVHVFDFHFSSENLLSFQQQFVKELFRDFFECILGSDVAVVVGEPLPRGRAFRTISVRGLFSFYRKVNN